MGIGVAAGDGGVDSVDGIDIGNGGVGAEGQGGAGIQKRAEGPHIRDALGPQIALRAAGIQGDVAGLHAGDDVCPRKSRDVVGLEVLQMLDGVMGGGGGGVRFEDVEAAVDGLVADGVDAHGRPFGRGRGHERLHHFGAHGGAPAVALEASVGVGVVNPGGVLAGNAIEELLEAPSRKERPRVGSLQGGQTAAVFQERGEHGHAHGELAGLFQGAEQVVPHEIEAGHGHERHVAHPRDAVLVQVPLEGAVGVQQLLARELRHDARHELHGRCLAHDARKAPVGIFVIAATGGRLALLRDAQAFQRAAVQPQRVGVPGVHGHGTCGVGRIQ